MQHLVCSRKGKFCRGISWISVLSLQMIMQMTKNHLDHLLKVNGLIGIMKPI